MRQRRKKSSEGLAMIMVLVMVVIFAALILAVVISSTTAIRRAHFYRDKTTALQIASAGVQDALYWMNYTGYPLHQYPCTYPPLHAQAGDYSADYKYFQGSDYAGTDTWTNTEPTASNNYNGYNPTNIQKGGCKVEFADSTTENEDLITSTGYYNGRTASISLKIRGSNGQGNINHDVPGTIDRYLQDVGTYGQYGIATWGTPEAFNKHAIYAKEVQAATGIFPTINGNIFTTSAINLIASAASQYTVTPVTDTPAYNFHLSSFTKPDTEIYRASIPAIPATFAAYFFAREDGDVCITTDDIGNDSILYPVPGVTYDSGIDTFTFGNISITYSFFVKGNYAGTANALFNDINLQITQHFRIGGDLTINNNLLTINYPVQVGGDLNITGPITTDTGLQSVFLVGGDVNLNSPVTNDFVVRGANSVNIAASIAGALVADEIKTGGVNINPLSIDATSSQYKAGIFINSTGSIDIPAAGSGLNIDANQNAGIVAYSSEGNVTITVNGNMNFPGKATIAAYSTAGDSIVTIGSNVGGLIYSRRGSGATQHTVIVNPGTSTINGTIATNDRVVFNQATTVQYDSSTYNDPANTMVYGNFKGGRRRYLPVPGSWEVTW